MDDSNSRCCAGMYECLMQKVPGQKSVPLQKRLLLYDLKDLYQNWLKESTYDTVPGFTMFTTLRPLQCVFAGDPGTHKVCICPVHQNVKLKLQALRIKHDYKDVLELSVCSIDNRECMLRECGQCKSKKDVVRQFLSEGNETTSNVTFKMWIQVRSATEDSSNSKTTLASLEEPFEQFIDTLTEDIWKLAEHQFINENQKNYISSCKKNLDADTCIMLMDFAEKYPFICQDSTQGFYFNNTTAIVHPFVMYYKNKDDDEIHVQSFCIISNASKQTAATVNIFQETVINHMKTEYPWVKKIIYFSDGSPTQYKNK